MLIVGVVVTIAMRGDDGSQTTTVAMRDADDGTSTSTTSTSLVAEPTTSTTETSETTPTTSMVTTTSPATTSPATTSPATKVPAAPPQEVCIADYPRPPTGRDLVGIQVDGHLREVSLDGGSTFDVPGTEGTQYGAAVWSDDGRRLAHQDAEALVVTDLVRGCRRILATTADGWFARDFAWDPSGWRLSYLRSGRGPGASQELVVVGADGTGHRVVASGAISGGDWAPDGSNRIAWTDREGLKITDLDSETTRIIHRSSEGVEYPEWSPDGSLISFAVSVNTGVWVARVDGDQGRKIAERWQTFWSSWSPDGSRLAYAFERDIWTIDPDGSDERRVTSGQDAHHKPRWSSDGSRIVFTNGGSGLPTDVVVVDLAGGAPVVIAENARLASRFTRS